eukprot:5627577-Pyramimonas_sp.AAC.1
MTPWPSGRLGPSQSKANLAAPRESEASHPPGRACSFGQASRRSALPSRARVHASPTTGRPPRYFHAGYAAP